MDKKSQISAQNDTIGFPISFQELREVHILYTCAIREICAKLENLSQEFELHNDRNPIQHIKHRLKTPESIRNKMMRKQIPLEFGMMQREILDIAGVRVICSYVEDIYKISRLLIRQDDISLIKKKDYIVSPKPNGYRSYHITVGIPVYLSKETKVVPVEIQMRTLAMDFWASLEHQLRYKPEMEISDSVRQRLTSLAGDMFKADVEIQQIYQEIVYAASSSSAHSRAVIPLDNTPA